MTSPVFKVSGVSLPIVLATGQNTTVNITFAPTSSTWFGGYLTFTSNGSSSALRIFIQGSGVSVEPVIAQPAAISFGQVAVGSSVTRSVTISNAVSYSETLQTLQVSGAGFSVTSPAMPFVLSAGKSIAVNVTFSPKAAGPVSGDLYVSGPYFNIPLSATGVTSSAVAQLSAAPSTLSLGSVILGSSATASGTLTATGASVTITAAATNNPAFTVSDLPLPTTLQAGQSVPYSVRFSPTIAGSVTAALSFTSNAQSSTITESLTGTGTAPVGQLTVNPASVNFGSIVVGNSGTASGTLTATGASVTITAAATNNPAFTVSGLPLPTTLQAGQSVPYSVRFSPTIAGSATAALSFTSNAQSSTTTESLTGTGTAAVGQLAVNPTSMSFGSIVVGSSGTASGSLSATGAAVTISAASTNNPAFKLSGLTAPLTIPAGQSVPFNVAFNPTASGSATGTLSFSSNAQVATTTESLSGTGTIQAGQLTVNPTTLSFGNVNVGSNATQACTLSASGAAVTVNSAGMSNSQFALSGASFPMTLNAGQSAEIFVIFSPTASGTDSATLTLNSNASNTKMTETLSGVGVTPQYSVSLTWNPSTSSVAGYNVYRGTSPGSYTKINSALNASTSYTDSTVASGATYYYAATAVTASGQESTYSTPVQVSIP